MSKEKGKVYEERGCEYLRENGFEIIERNFFSRFGEIDIIALKDNVLHFIEVKGSEKYCKTAFEIKVSLQMKSK